MSATTAVTATTADRFTADVLESDGLVIVDFWATWCPPCRQMRPLLAQLAEARDDLRVVTVDVDVEQELAARYGVLSMPTFLVFRDGAPVLRLVGARPRARLERELSAVV